VIKFHTLKYKNFLSTGDSWTEVDFENSKTTLVVGQNGAGKSTMLDALSYALFGKAHRNINKPQLINSINQKDMMVEVKFSVEGSLYTVIRGLKRTKFEIWRDDVLINQDSHSKDHQKILEQNILKLNHKSFHQIVVLGSSSFVPFMQLPAHIRREVIEDLLDINVFSTMNQLLKQKTALLKESLTSNSHDLQLVQTKIDAQKAHLCQIHKISESAKQEKLDKIAQEESELARLNTQVTEWEETVLLDLQSRQKSLDKKITELGKYVFQFDSKQKATNKEILFYEDNEDCPTCDQTIETSFRLDKVQNAKHKWDELEEARHAAEFKVQGLTDDRESIQKSIDEETEKLNALKTTKEKITWTQNRINTLQSELSELETGVHSVSEARDTLAVEENKKSDLTEQKLQLAEQKEYHNVITELLKDTGIKTKIIKQYLPVINKLTNQYLQILDFYVHFDLDESFKETIRSRHRDAFSYDSFSEGEKQRIDLALLFTWRQVAKMKNSIATNLLILDETFDSSLDADGVENLLKIIETLGHDTNTFVISHKGEVLQQNFERKIEFVKHKNFSKIAA
jgi:DNA repair exonuclease SbcCD ATPase subunit